MNGTEYLKSFEVRKPGFKMLISQPTRLGWVWSQGGLTKSRSLEVMTNKAVSGANQSGCARKTNPFSPWSLLFFAFSNKNKKRPKRILL